MQSKPVSHPNSTAWAKKEAAASAAWVEQKAAAWVEKEAAASEAERQLMEMLEADKEKKPKLSRAAAGLHLRD